MSLTNQAPDAFQIEKGPATGTLDISYTLFDLLWAPITGPTAVVMLRSLTAVADFLEPASVVSVMELASTTGVAPTRFIRAVSRAQQFGLARANNGVLYVPERVHTPPAALLHRLPVLTQQMTVASGDLPGEESSAGP